MPKILSFRTAKTLLAMLEEDSRYSPAVGLGPGEAQVLRNHLHDALFTLRQERLAPRRGPGRLEVIVGNMSAGKSSELLRRLERAVIAGQSVILLKHHIDTRYAQNEVVTHGGLRFPAVPIAHVSDIDDLPRKQYDVVGIDEAQFFGPDLVSAVMNRVIAGELVIVTGLDMDFKGAPFSVVAELMARADVAEKLAAVCTGCGEPAVHTQRLLDGVPTSEGDTIQVGGMESYTSVCRLCYVGAQNG